MYACASDRRARTSGTQTTRALVWGFSIRSLDLALHVRTPVRVRHTVAQPRSTGSPPNRIADLTAGQNLRAVENRKDEARRMGLDEKPTPYSALLESVCDVGTKDVNWAQQARTSERTKRKAMATTVRVRMLLHEWPGECATMTLYSMVQRLTPARGTVMGLALACTSNCAARRRAGDAPSCARVWSSLPLAGRRGLWPASPSPAPLRRLRRRRRRLGTVVLGRAWTPRPCTQRYGGGGQGQQRVRPVQARQLRCAHQRSVCVCVGGGVRVRTVLAVPKENAGAVGATSPCSRGRELKEAWTTLRTDRPPLS